MSAETISHVGIVELVHQQQNNLGMSNTTFSEYDRLKALAITGASLGVLHVLAGPDHLSALAALAVGNSYKAFNLGFRWGIGHSTGLIVVAIIFIYLKGNLDLKLLGRYCDGLVGAFMILLGSYGVFAALEVSRQNNKKRDDSLSSPNSKSSNSLMTLLDNNISNNNINTINNSNSNTNNNNSSSSSISPTNHNSHNNHNNSFNTEIDSHVTKKPKKKSAKYYNLNHVDAEKGGDGGSLYTSHDSLDTDDDDKYNYDEYTTTTNTNNNNNNNLCAYLSMIDMREPFIQRIVSFSIGLLHGVAGPGGILGVLPAVEMRSWKSSITYLSCFVIASTLSMGIFASLYGELTKRLGATQQCVDLSLRVFSSTMSIGVGILWFVLSVFGNKDKYFH